MKYLRKFENHAAYEAAQSGLILPNLSLCASEDEMHYNPYVGPYAGHDYVEIGGLKWATMNIGATAVTDTGLYFQWGDTSGYTAAQVGTDKNFSWADYKYGSSRPFSKYDTDGKTVLDASDDAAQANWGGKWRMPTTAEFAALGTATTSAWTADYEGSGVSGLVLTSNADSSKKLFFPAAGRAYDGSVIDVGSHGRYWGSSLSSGSVYNAYGFYFDSGSVYWQLGIDRNFGFPVRGVVDE